MTLSQRIQSWIRHPLVISIALMTLAFATYCNVLDGTFIWDDEVMVASNGLIRSLDNIPSILTTSPFGGRLNASDFYRPFQTMSYAIDYSFWGLDPFGFHLTNVILHCLTVVIIFLLIGRLGYSLWVAGWGAAIFAVHPLNTEAVSYISGRGDVMYLLLCVTVFWLFTHTSFKRLWIVPIALGLYWIALLTKENAVPLGVLLAGLIMFPVFAPLNRTQKWMAALLAMSSILYAGMRAYFLATQGNTVLSWIASASLLQRLQTIPYCIWTYFRLILIPFPLHMEYHYVETSWLNPYLWFGLPAMAVFGYGVWRYSSRRSQVVFWTLWALICLGPVFQLAPLAATVREHWATMAQLGFWIALLSVAATAKIPKTWLSIGIATIVAFYAGLTIARNADWRVPLRLYEHDVALEPRSFLLHNNVGVEYYRHNNIPAAKAAFEAAIANSPNLPLGYGTALNNLGAIYEGHGDLVKAESLYIKSIASSQYELAYSNLARVLLMRGDTVNAIRYINDGLIQYPYNATLKMLLIGAYYTANRPDDAERDARSLLMMYPEYRDQINSMRSRFEELRRTK